MCCCSALVSFMVTPSLSTDVNLKSSLAASSSTFIPCAAFINSPSLFNNFNAFHSLGLWLAVRMMPPQARSATTAISTVGVVLRSASITSRPSAFSVLITRFFTISPLMRPSLPTTIFLEKISCGLSFNNKVPNAAVNFTMSNGVRLSPVFPPIVPLIPDILFINAIRYHFSERQR